MAGIEAGEMTARSSDGLRELAREHPRFGYRRLHLYLHEEMGVNHKKVQRLYRELDLSVKRTRRKHLRRTLTPRPVLTAPNEEWALDFASDVTAGGQRFRVFGVIDCFTPSVPGAGSGGPAFRADASRAFLSG